MISKQIIMEKALSFSDEIIAIRRAIHMHPETGLKEYKTSKLIEEKLKALKLEVKTQVGITGVTGVLYGKYPGKTVLLRADMDALEIHEENDVEYRSQTDGMMHACGHDAHVAWLLGTAFILESLKDHLHGNVIFLFQPAEETEGGAERMIDEGVLENPKVDAVIGAHVWPALDVGKVAVKKNTIMAGSDLFKIKINGKGGHIAEPHNCIDPISIASQVCMSLQTVVSRKIDPTDSVVLSFSTIHGGTATNVIPDVVEIQGNARYLTWEMREKLPMMIESIVDGITKANGGSYELNYMPFYPPVVNDATITELVKKSAQKLLGTENALELDTPSMCGEDFSYFLKERPGTFFFVGTKNEEKNILSPLHNCTFNIDESILHQTSALFSQSVFDFLVSDEN